MCQACQLTGSHRPWLWDLLTLSLSLEFLRLRLRPAFFLTLHNVFTMPAMTSLPCSVLPNGLSRIQTFSVKIRKVPGKVVCLVTLWLKSPDAYKFISPYVQLVIWHSHLMCFGYLKAQCVQSWTHYLFHTSLPPTTCSQWMSLTVILL
jgi:hypothetical protein